MKPVRRNTYIQLGTYSHGQWYPLRKFPRTFTERWANPQNNCKLKFRKPCFVDMIIKRDGRKMKRIYRGMLYNRRANDFVIMSVGNRKNLDFHRVRV